MSFIFQRKMLFIYTIFGHHGIDDESIEDALKTLTKRESKVLKMRFGLGCKIYTLEGVGQQFKVTRERIRQIEAKALRKLKHPSRSEKLKKFI